MGAILPMNIKDTKISSPLGVAVSDNPVVNPTVPRAETVSNHTFIKDCSLSVIDKRMLVMNAQDIAKIPIDTDNRIWDLGISRPNTLVYDLHLIVDNTEITIIAIVLTFMPPATDAADPPISIKEVKKKFVCCFV